MAGGAHTLVRNVSSGAVAAIAAWSSYSHMVHLAVRHAERAEVAWALPFSVDGMLIVSTIVMVDDKRHGHRVRPMARLAFTTGVIASIAANIAEAFLHAILSAADTRGLLSHEHFTVDGTLLEAWALPRHVILSLPR